MGKSDSETLLVSILRNIAVQINDKNEGWPDKYGASKNNEVFKMSPYCWCDKEDCPQCWDQDEIGLPSKEIVDANGMGVDEDGYISAPNFWHKKSGLKVWWYKYIGRGMKSNRELCESELEKIEADCLASLSRWMDNCRTKNINSPAHIIPASWRWRNVGRIIFQ